MTPAQARLLRYADDGGGDPAILDGFYIDCSLWTGWSGAALDAVIAACQRRGWLDDCGRITNAGRQALARARGQQ